MRSARQLLNNPAQIGILILRRSTDRQDKSVEEQREFNTKWAATHGYRLVGEYVDDAVSGDTRQAVRAMLERTYGSKKENSGSELMNRYKNLKEQVEVLERLDSGARAKINLEERYHEMKEDLAQISKRMEPETGNPVVDIERHVEEITKRLETLKNFEKLSPERQKAFFAQFVERITLRFRKVPRGKGMTSRIKDGTLDLRLRLGARENRGSVAEAPVMLRGNSGWGHSRDESAVSVDGGTR